MSVTTTQKQDFANYIRDHDAFESIMDDMQMQLFSRSLKASKLERDVISDTALGLQLFVTELNAIISKILDDEPVNDEPEDTHE